MNFTMDTQRRELALQQAFKSIESSYGKGSVMKLGAASALEVETIPTGSLALDIALGCGGYPRGRLVEIFGPEASGKTTLALHAIASVQNEGGTAAFIDAEHALDPSYASALGVDIDELVISQPDCGEQALEIAETLVRSGAVEIVVVDSVAALVPRIELDGGMEDVQVGLQARMMSKAMRKLANCVSRSNAILIFINQVRSKIGVSFGSNETTSGGRALRYFASVRIDIRRIGSIKEGDKIIGNRTRIKVVKNKLAPPFKMVELDLIYGIGISTIGDLIDLGIKHGIIKRAGAYYSFGDEKLGRGREAVRERLSEDKQTAQQIQALILADPAES